MNDSKVLAICGSIVTMFLIGAVVMLAHAPDGGEAATRSVGLLISTLAPTIGSIVLVIRQGKVNTKTDTIQKNTEKMLNGVMDEKIKTNLHEVLDQRDAAEK